jgi:hypothetical protein
MAIQTEYFDPDTGIIHIFNQEELSVASGATGSTELGLEDTTFNDVKVKLLSVEYRVRLFTAESGDTTGKMFSTSYGDNGFVLFGIGNKTENFDTYTSLGVFQGTSSWPVQIIGYQTMVGNNQSITKTWKPRKTGLSNEQNAFITIRSEAVTSGCYAGTSIYMRMIRL